MRKSVCIPLFCRWENWGPNCLQILFKVLEVKWIAGGWGEGEKAQWVKCLLYRHEDLTLEVASSVLVTRVWLTGSMIYLKWWGPGLMIIPASESKKKRKLSKCRSYSRRYPNSNLCPPHARTHIAKHTCVLCIHAETLSNTNTQKGKGVLEPTSVTHSAAPGCLPTYHTCCTYNVSGI